MPTLNERGEPKANGVDDWRDSAVLNGLLVCFDIPGAVPIENYINQHGRLIRCYGDDPCDTSRDNFTPTVAAAHKLDKIHLVRFAVERVLETNFFPNGDILSPGLKSYFEFVLGIGKLNWWFTLELWFNAKVTPMAESNQLLCILGSLKDDWYLKKYCQWNPEWALGIKNYWSEWRNDPDVTFKLLLRISERRIDAT